MPMKGHCNEPDDQSCGPECRFSADAETPLDEETPEVCMATKSPDIDSHVSRADEIEAFAQIQEQVRRSWTCPGISQIWSVML